MQFEDIIGQDVLKQHLIKTVDENRISHAQLFIEKEEYGGMALAIAYAQYILCGINNDSCNAKFNTLTHPDLHFVFPVNTPQGASGSSKKYTSDFFITQWREFILNNLYGSLNDWYTHINIDKKQGVISKEEANNIVRTLSLKPMEGKYKVMIIWHPEKMNESSANALLKIIEEPPQKIIFLLVTQNEEQIINTIRSRVQPIKIKPIENLHQQLIDQFHLDIVTANSIAKQAKGNWNKALKLQTQDNDLNLEIKKSFVVLVRSAFKTDIKTLIEWANEISKHSRENIKKFLFFYLEIFRQSLLSNYQIDELIFTKIKTNGFNFKNFSKFVHHKNIELIIEELEKGIYHIERNVNSKIVLLDSAIHISRYLHLKPN